MSHLALCALLSNAAFEVTDHGHRALLETHPIWTTCPSATATRRRLDFGATYCSNAVSDCAALSDEAQACYSEMDETLDSAIGDDQGWFNGLMIAGTTALSMATAGWSLTASVVTVNAIQGIAAGVTEVGNTHFDQYYGPGMADFAQCALKQEKVGLCTDCKVYNELGGMIDRMGERVDALKARTGTQFRWVAEEMSSIRKNTESINDLRHLLDCRAALQIEWDAQRAPTTLDRIRLAKNMCPALANVALEIGSDNRLRPAAGRELCLYIGTSNHAPGDIANGLNVEFHNVMGKPVPMQPPFPLAGLRAFHDWMVSSDVGKPLRTMSTFFGAPFAPDEIFDSLAGLLTFAHNANDAISALSSYMLGYVSGNDGLCSVRDDWARLISLPGGARLRDVFRGQYGRYDETQTAATLDSFIAQLTNDASQLDLYTPSSGIYLYKPSEIFRSRQSEFGAASYLELAHFTVWQTMLHMSTHFDTWLVEVADVMEESWRGCYTSYNRHCNTYLGIERHMKMTLRDCKDTSVGLCYKGWKTCNTYYSFDDCSNTYYSYGRVRGGSWYDETLFVSSNYDEHCQKTKMCNARLHPSSKDAWGHTSTREFTLRTDTTERKRTGPIAAGDLFLGESEGAPSAHPIGPFGPSDRRAFWGSAPRGSPGIPEQIYVKLPGYTSPPFAYARFVERYLSTRRNGKTHIAQRAADPPDRDRNFVLSLTDALTKQVFESMFLKAVESAQLMDEAFNPDKAVHTASAKWGTWDHASYDISSFTRTHSNYNALACLACPARAAQQGISCAKRARCSTATCPSSMFKKANARKLFCSGESCTSSDWNTCCTPRATCATLGSCPAMFGTSPDLFSFHTLQSSKYCAGSKCSKEADFETCCELPSWLQNFIEQNPGQCFHEATQFETKEGTKTAAQLRVGDEVRVATHDGKQAWDTIALAVSHGNKFSRQFRYLNVNLANGTQLTLSANHYLHVLKDGENASCCGAATLRPASNVTMGDTVWLADPSDASGGLTPHHVRSVVATRHESAYNFLLLQDGFDQFNSIIANGVVASSFTTQWRLMQSYGPVIADKLGDSVRALYRGGLRLTSDEVDGLAGVLDANEDGQIYGANSAEATAQMFATHNPDNSTLFAMAVKLQDIVADCIEQHMAECTAASVKERVKAVMGQAEAHVPASLLQSAMTAVDALQEMDGSGRLPRGVRRLMTRIRSLSVMSPSEHLQEHSRELAILTIVVRDEASRICGADVGCAADAARLKSDHLPLGIVLVVAACASLAVLALASCVLYARKRRPKASVAVEAPVAVASAIKATEVPKVSTAAVEAV